MNAKRGTRGIRIAVFYSLGPHFDRTLKQLRAEYPDGEITVLVPPGYPLSELALECIDQRVENEITHFSPTNVGACRRLVRGIRAGNYDLFAVLFDSMQLNILSALSGARERICCPPQGGLAAMRSTIPGIVAVEALRRTLGNVVYAGIWLVVHLMPVRGHE